MHKLLVTAAATLLLTALLGCAEESKPFKDKGVTDKGSGKDTGTQQDKAPAPDQAAGDLKGAADLVGDLSDATLEQDTIAFVTYLAGQLPATAGAKKVETYVPGDNAVAGWVADPAHGLGVEAGYDNDAIQLLINGTHDPYNTEGCAGFAKQDYIKGWYKMSLYLWQMNTKSGAEKMYTNNKDYGEKMLYLTFTAISGVQDQAIIAKDNPQFKAYAQKGPYIFRVYTTYNP